MTREYYIKPLTTAAFLCSFLAFSTAVFQARDRQTANQNANSDQTGQGDTRHDGPFASSEVTKKAVIHTKPDPGFSDKARRNDTQGTVRLRVVLAASGKVTDISIINGLPDGLTERAIEAARKIKFTPAQKDGRPVSIWLLLEYNFNIYESESSTTRMAEILEMPNAEYTEEARQRKIKGKVVLTVFLHRDGQIGTMVVKGLPYGLTEKAVEAARRIKFVPAEIKGRAVSVFRQIEYVFSID